MCIRNPVCKYPNVGRLIPSMLNAGIPSEPTVSQSPTTLIFAGCEYFNIQRSSSVKSLVAPGILLFMKLPDRLFICALIAVKELSYPNRRAGLENPELGN